MKKIKKVLVFGTFDMLHEGHMFFLKSAKKYGDTLIVVVAKDETVKRLKGKEPMHNEKERVLMIRKTGIAAKVLPGKKKNHYTVLSEISPDIICLGYDQTYFVDKLSEELKRRSLSDTKIIRIKPYKKHKYKSSLLRK